MKINASDENRLWELFQGHIGDCAQCCDVAQPLCAEGTRLEKLWALADAVASRAEQEADDTADCANEPWTDERPWSPEL